MATSSKNRLGLLSNAGGFLYFLVFVVTVMIFTFAPFLAIAWSARPFPGFVVEQTLVVSDYGQESWGGIRAGIKHPEHLTHIDQAPLNTLSDFNRAIASLSPGQTVSVQTVLPDGLVKFYPYIELGEYAFQDLLLYFWLPYLVGCVYLLLGAWIFRMRGNTSAGRSFAYFCLCSALVNALTFDLTTTHLAAFIWLIAISQLGFAFSSLAFTFPEEAPRVKYRAWLRWPIFGVSVFLAAWGLRYLYDYTNPWAYIPPFEASYVFSAFGIALFLGMMVYRLFSRHAQAYRPQILIILVGSLVSFVPVGLFFASSTFGISIRWNPVFFLPILLVFPISMGIALVRYHLWDVQVLLNRTLVYGLLTVLLTGIYLVSILILQLVFIQIIGERSPIAIAISTLAIALLFNPTRGKVQDFIDYRFFRHKYLATRALSSLTEAIRQEVDLEHLEKQLVDVINETMQPASISFCTCMKDDEASLSMLSRDDPLHSFLITSEDAVLVDEVDFPSPTVEELRKQDARLIVPLVSQGELVGMLKLGQRSGGQPYTLDDRRLLMMFAGQAASAVRIAQMIRSQQIEDRERQRIESELRVASIVQRTLLPKALPDLPGWRITTHYQPAREVGGDFFDFIDYGDGRMGLVFGDVTDKGVPAALVMASTRSIVRSVAIRQTSPGQVLRQVNELLIPDMPKNMFVTCLYAILEPGSGRITFANAGQCLPFQLSQGEVIELRATGMPLGLLPDMDYEQTEACIAPGDRFFLYSDGLLEAHSPQRELFGLRRLKSLFKLLPQGVDPPVFMLDGLATFTGADWEQEDDVTMLLLERHNS